MPIDISQYQDLIDQLDEYESKHPGMNNYDFDQAKEEAEKLVPGLGEYIIRKGLIVTGAAGRYDTLIAPLPPESIEAVYFSDNPLIPWDVNEMFQFSSDDPEEMEKMLSSYTSKPGEAAALVPIVKQIREEYAQKHKGADMSLPEFLTRYKKKSSYLDQAINSLHALTNKHIYSPKSQRIQTDPVSRVVGGIWNRSPDEYGQQLFFPTGADGDESIGIHAIIRKNPETLDKEIQEVNKSLDSFARRLLRACDKELEAGNKATPLNRLHKGMGYTTPLNSRQRKIMIDYLDSFNALILDLENELEILAGYDYPRAGKIYPHGPILPNRIIRDPEGLTTFNGQPTEYVEFLVDHITLALFAHDREWEAELPPNIYETGNSKTERNIKVEDYLLERIVSKKMNKPILVDTVCEVAGIDPRNGSSKSKLKKMMRKTFDGWMNEQKYPEPIMFGYVEDSRSFTIIKDKKEWEKIKKTKDKSDKTDSGESEDPGENNSGSYRPAISWKK